MKYPMPPSAPRGAVSARCVTLVLLALGGSGPARADDPPQPPDGAWVGKGQGGLLVTSGNSSASSVNARVDLAETQGPWKNVVYVGGQYGKANGLLNSERLEGKYELDHKISGRLFWFGSVDGIKDLFSGFNYQATLSTGLGYTIFDTAETKLSTTVGVGYQRLQKQVVTTVGTVTERTNEAAEGSVVGTAGAVLEQKLTSTTKLTDKLAITAGSLNTAVGNDLAVAVSLTDTLALSVGYGIRYNTAPAPGVQKLDQTETVNIVFNFK